MTFWQKHKWKIIVPVLIVLVLAAAFVFGDRNMPKQKDTSAQPTVAAPVETPAGQVEVVEFFAYSCIHCYNFEPLLADWIKKKPVNVVVRRTPVAFSEAFVPMQRLYYTLEAMGQVEALHEKVFRAYHVDKVKLQDPAVITEWVAKQGVDVKKFNELFASFSMAGKAKKAALLQDAYQVEGTPALGVAGRFYIPGQGPRTIQIAEALIAQIRKG